MYKYMSLVDSLRKEIYLGKYKPGSKLPSIQKISKETGLNSDTIVKAYKELEQEHVIYAVPKSGFYVMENDLEMDNSRLIDLDRVILPDRINPFVDFQHCIEQAIGVYRSELFQYGSPKGFDALTQSLVKHLQSLQVYTKKENLFITNGSQQALHIISTMQFPKCGKKVLVEQPTYSLMLRILHHAGIPVIGIRREANGIDLDYLEKLFRQGDIKFFYVMPRYQNPTGFCYSTEQKKEMVRLADRYGVYILEDDYLADLEVDPKADTLHTLGNRERIIYLRSLSKTILPGLRLGMVVIPDVLQKQFLDMKYCMDLSTPILTQAALDIFLRSGMYQHHLKRTREYYQNRMDLMRMRCSENQDPFIWHIPATGIYAYLETGQISSALIEKKLLDNKVLVSSTNPSYIEGTEHPEGVRICVCSAENHEIEHAIRVIEDLYLHN